ncbi:MAG: porin family protein [Treponema sp.]|nr:porin family protein [Treponema sp.]
MKKIIAMAVAAVCFVSASFALDLEFGARGILGKQVSGLKESVNEIKADPNFDLGGGVYGNFALFGGLGVQAEANVIKSTLSISKDGASKGDDYDMYNVDLAPMVWLNLDLWRLTIGAGVGPNFNIALSNLGDIAAAKKDQFKMGLAAGADVKFYITNHLGLVVSGRYIMEFQKKEVPIEIEGFQTGGSYPTIDYTRKTLYGGVGLEYKLF